MRGKGFELVWSGLERKSGLSCNGVCDLHVKPNTSVDPSADGRTALGKQVDISKRLFNTCNAVLQLFDIPTELHAQAKWSGVLGMCPSNLNDISELTLLGP